MPKKTDQKTGEEKRKYKRVSILQDLHFGGKSIRKMENISEDGMFIPAADVFMSGSVLDLKFTLSNNQKPIVVKGEVRHAQEGVGMGVKFMDLKPADRKQIRAFVKKYSK
jgi:c-di-GMP-binding flagellar brake protein YcgR